MNDPRVPANSGEQPAVDALDVLVVRVADERYGLPGVSVREVVRWRAPTPVPGAPSMILGIVSQRGVVLPVVDLRLALGLAAAPPERSARLVVAQHEATDLALFVDAVVDLAKLPIAGDRRDGAKRYRAALPAGLDSARARLLAAVAHYDDRPLPLLDLAVLIAAVQEGG